MEKLFQYSASQIDAVNPEFKRYLWDKINWKNRLIAITGARGTGKTTFLLQYIKENLGERPGEVMYASADDLYFSSHSLVDFAGEFVKRGGKYLFLDEIHKYMNWSKEIKNIYDYFQKLKVVLTGSSALNIYKGTADLSRRAIVYHLQGLSFREFILFKYKHSFPLLSLGDLVENPSRHVSRVLKEIKPIKLFEEYLRSGYYPFFIEDESTFNIRLKQTVNHVLDVDLPSVEHIDFNAVHHLRILLSVISEIVPFRPNILNLSRQVGVSRETLLKYLYLLSRADLLMLLQTNKHSISKLNKPDKIYLNNSNLMFALSQSQVNQGSLRETFLFNQLKEQYTVSYTENGDFLVSGKYTFEVGGKNKTRKQIAGIKDSFVVADNIEHPYQNVIPLWLFGFLY